MDLATVGGAFLSASLQVLFDRIASRDVLNVLRGHKLSPSLLRKLKINLLAVQAVLDDAEAKQFTSSAVRQWVDELKHAVYDAEDLLDDITTEALRSTMEPDSLNKVRTIISSLLSPFGAGIQSRTDEITDVLETLANRKAALGLNEGVGGKLWRRWPATSLVDESGVYGRRDDKDEIVRFLLSNVASGSNTNVSVIALVGMGGIGKTTLANLVYKDESVEKFFESKAWVCVSDEFDIVSITKTILKTLNVPIPDENDLNQLQLKLRDSLSRKKFLLVLDDVWNESFHNWDLLQTPFTVGMNGSKIIVTTRSIKVASVMRSIHTRHLEQLSFEDCWTLFAKHAFVNGDPSPHPKLEEIGKEIVKKCQGLPLAAKTLGAALYSELQLKEWENILKSEIWDLPNDVILPALRLSYDHLPSQLKRCFAYCAIFPKDFEIKKERLILLWMAEGFLQPSEEGGKEMEDIGNAYFDELLSRSFFQKSSSTRKSHFVMHDLIADLAHYVSKKFCLHSKNGKTHEFPKKLRHFSFFEIRNDIFGRFVTPDVVNSLRTFLTLHDFYDSFPHPNEPIAKYYYKGSYFQLSNGVVKDLLSKAEYLRVLSLSGYGSVTYLPDAIGNLKHLCYLDLSCTGLRNLPDSVCNLYNLQTLILSFCQYLVELPKKMSKLVRLRHLDIRHCYGIKKMPSQMGKLTCLRILTDYRVGKKSGTRVGELRELSLISGSLHIKELQDVEDGKDASEANLVGKQYLDDLRLQWNVRSGVEQSGADEVVLNNLQPHPNLKRLTIGGYGGSRFSDWLRGPEILINMVFLLLWNCNNVSAFPPLGQLPCLQHLYISGAAKVERVGVEFYGADPSSTKPSFASLKALSFASMLKWKDWVCGGGQGREFPRLEELSFEYCPELTGGLPDHLPLLKRLEIRECERLVAPLPKVPAIRDLDMGGSGGVLLRNNASSDFMCLESLTTSSLSQWKELPPLLQAFKIVRTVNSIESSLEEGILQSNNCLQHLAITHCSFSKTLGTACLPLTLISLRLNSVENVEFLLSALFKCHFPFLKTLDIREGTCNSITCFPLSIFPSLTHLEIYHLQGLESLSFMISDEGVPPPSLEFFCIQGCPNLVAVELPDLNFVTFTIYNCKNLKSLLHNNASFQSLRLEYCSELIFPIRGLPASLTSLTIRNCKKLTSQMEVDGQSAASLPSLTHFQIDGGGVDRRNKCLHAQFCTCWGSL